MKKNDMNFLKDYLLNLQVDVVVTDYTQCWNSWRDYNFTPTYNKFYFICEGEGWLKINGKEFYPKPGQMFLLPSGVLQSYSTINETPFKKYWCHFNAKVGNMNLFDVINVPYFIDVPQVKELEKLFKSMIANHRNGGIISFLKVKSIMLDIIIYYLENSHDDNLIMFEDSFTNKLNTLTKYINENMTNNISIEQMAHLLHFHPNYFTRFFTKHMGMSPVQYIRKVRIEKAKYLLKTTAHNVSEVAEIVGFNDLYHFSKTFKSVTGFSPSDFRKV